MKKLFILMCLAMFLVGTVTALEWDNVRDYDESTKTITITNALGLGDTIATVKLNTPLNNKIGLGYQKVFEFTIDSFEDYEEALKQIEYFDINKEMEETNVQLDLKYKEIVLENVTKNVCTSKDNKSICVEETEQVERITWNDYPNKDMLKGEITIAGFTNAKEGDYIEFIPTWFGERMYEFANWGASLNTGLVAYWSLDETTGDFIDIHTGTWNGTEIGTLTRGVEGIKNNSVTNDGNNNKINITGSESGAFAVEVLTFCAWINTSYSSLSVDLMMDKASAYNLEIKDSHLALYDYGGTDQKEGTFDIATGTWQFVCAVYNSTDADLYVNATFDVSVASSVAAQGTLRLGGNNEITQSFNGTYDEMMFWNRTLSASEITTLYANGLGLFYGEQEVNVVLESPIDFYNSTVSDIIFNASATSVDDGIANISLYLDGVLNYTPSYGGHYEFDGDTDYVEITNNNLSDFTVSMWIDKFSNIAGGTMLQNGWDSTNKVGFQIRFDSGAGGKYIYLCVANSTDADCINTCGIEIQTNELNHFVVKYVNSTGESYVYKNGALHCEGSILRPGMTFPLIEEGFIGKGSGFFNGSIDEVRIFNKSLTPTEVTNLYNQGREEITGTVATDNLVSYWDLGKTGADDVVGSNDGTNTGATPTIKLSYPLSLPIDSYVWNTEISYLNSSNYVNLFAPTNFTLNLGSTVNSITFNETSYETERETYLLNLTSFDESTPTNAQLNWNGTNYTATITALETGNFSLSYSKIIPIVNVTANASIQFNWENNGATEYSNISNQTINVIDFSLCEGGTPYLNLTFKDESNSSELNAAISTSSFEYWLGDRTVTKNYTLINNTENQNYTFCFNITDRNVNVDTRIQYTSTNYPQRVYDPVAVELTNVSTNPTLYLLSAEDGLYVTLQIVNSANQVLSGVDITISRTIEATPTVVGFGTTSETGAATFWLNPDFEHTFVFEKEGFTTATKIFAPTEAGYTLTLEGGQVLLDNYFKGIDRRVLPNNSFLENDTAYDFGLTLTSSFWDVSEYGFDLRLADGSIVTGDSTSTSGTQLILNYDVTNQTIIYMDYYWVVSGNYTNVSLSWNVFNTANTQWSIRHFFTDLNNYLDVGFFGIDNFGRTLIVFMILFGSIGILSYKYGINNPEMVATMIFGIIFFFEVVVNLIPPIRGIENLLTYASALILVVLLFRRVQRA